MGKDASGTTINTSAYVGRLLESIPTSYTVWKDGTDYRAECNIASGTDFGPLANAQTVIQAAIDALTAGRTWKERVLLKCEAEIDDQIELPTYTVLQGGHIKQKAGANVGDGGGGALLLISGPHSEIRDLTIDFNGAAQGYSGNPATTWIHAIQVGEQESQGKRADYAVIDNVVIKNAFGREKDANLTVSCIDIFNAPYTKVSNAIFDVFDAGIVVTCEFEGTTVSKYDISHLTALNGKDVSEAIYYEYGTAKINHVYIDNSRPIYLPKMQNGELNDIYITNPLSQISIGTVGTVTGRISNLTIDGYKIYVTNADSLKLINIIVKNAAGHGLGIHGGDVEIINPHISTCTEFGINLEGATVYAKITGGLVEGCTKHGLVIQTSAQALVDGLDILDCAKNTTDDGVYVSTSHNILQRMRIEGTDHVYSIKEDGSPDYNIFKNLIVDQPLLIVGSNTRLRNIDGFVTENSGITGAIATGATVTHGLVGTPTMVTVTAAESGPTDIYVSAVGATTFVINYGGGGTKTFYWQAEYKP